MGQLIITCTQTNTTAVLNTNYCEMWFQTQCQRRKCKSGHIKFWLTQACPYFNKLLPLFLIFLAKYKGMGGFSWLLNTVHATIVVIVWVNYCRSHCTLTVPCSQKRSVLYCHFFCSFYMQTCISWTEQIPRYEWIADNMLNLRLPYALI